MHGSQNTPSPSTERLGWYTSHSRPMRLGTFPKPIAFEALPDDIHHLIFCELQASSPPAVFTVAQASRALRSVALPFVYRHIVLDNSPEVAKTQETYRAIIERLHKDAAIPLAQYVRIITIKSNVPEAALISVLNKISECGTLRKLSWKTPAHMPHSVLDKLHTTWPNLHLAVHIPTRPKAGSSHQLDLSLLSSPLLRDLICPVYNQGTFSDQPARSEWPQLTEAILNGGGIRRLCIQSFHNRTDPLMSRNIPNYDNPETLTSLYLALATRLPALEEFGVRTPPRTHYANYNCDVYHYRLLMNAMDWSRLRKLDFGSAYPARFFVDFAGKMPNIKALRFGPLPHKREKGIRFIQSLKYLESLDIAHADRGHVMMWECFTKHGDTLKELILRPSTDNDYIPRRFDEMYWESLVNDFPALERLGWITECESHQNQIHPAVIRKLSRMKLKKLDLFIHLPIDSTVYSDALDADDPDSHPPLLKDSSHKAGINIMERISQDQGLPLEWLTFHFSRSVIDKEGGRYLIQAKMQVRRTMYADAGDDKKYEFRGRQEWYEGSTSIEEERCLEEE